MEQSTSTRKSLELYAMQDTIWRRIQKIIIESNSCFLCPGGMNKKTCSVLLKHTQLITIPWRYHLKPNLMSMKITPKNLSLQGKCLAPNAEQENREALEEGAKESESFVYFNPDRIVEHRYYDIGIDQGYRNFEIQIGPLDRWRHRRHTNMSSTIPNSHENSSFSSKSVSEIDYFFDTIQLQPVVSRRSRDNPKSLA